MAKKPMIVIFLLYASFLIFAELAGFFNPQNRSLLYHFTRYNVPVLLEGKIISEPVAGSKTNRFILKAYSVDNLKINEKVLVYLPNVYEVSYGDIIAVEGEISLPQKAAFPLVFDYSQYLARDEIYTTLRADSFEFISSDPNPIMKAAAAIRKDIVSKIDKNFRKEIADIFKPLIIGDKTSLEPETREIFIDAGLMHILVVSGLHIGFVGALLLVILKLLGLSLRKTFLLTIPILFLYVLASGANPPAVRAGIMFSCILISLSLDREPLIYNSLALSALIILILQPQSLFTASFQMSYLATIGIVYFYGKLYALIKEGRNFIFEKAGIYPQFFSKKTKFFMSVFKALAGVFCLTASAQIMTIPLTAYYFGKISLISLLANMLIVPTIGLITMGGFIFYFLTFVSDFLAKGASFVLSLPLDGVLICVKFLGSLKFSSMQIAKPAIWQIIFILVLAFVVPFFRRNKIFAVVFLTIFAATFVSSAIYERHREFERVYENKNMRILHKRQNGKDMFEISQKGKYYDKFFMSSFEEFLGLAGIGGEAVSLERGGLLRPEG